MNKDRFTSYHVRIEASIACVDVLEKTEGFYICLFNKEAHKDFINGLKGLGFVVCEEDKTTIYYPIRISEKTELNEELIANIWRQIKDQDLYEKGNE